MRTIATITLTAIALAVPATANAGTFVHFDNGTPATKYNKWIRTSKVAQPDADVEIHELSLDDVSTQCGDSTALGCSAPTGPGHAVIYLTTTVPSAYAFTNQRALFFHEMGHVYDDAMLNNRQRIRFKVLADAVKLTWRSEDQPYENRPIERFAQAYATCAIVGGSPKGSDVAVYSYEPTGFVDIPSVLRADCLLINRSSLGTGLLDYTPKH